jgi:hypothetical protein
MEQKEFDDKIKFDAPIPGQSLTQNPESPMPYERPPEFVDYEQAQEYLFDKMTDTSDDIIDLIADGIPLSIMAVSAVFSGFAEGKWNPDLMMLLIEPALYILMFIAEQSGVEYVLDTDEEFRYLPAESRMKAESFLSDAVKDVAKKIQSETASADIRDVMPESLLAKVEEETGGEGGMIEEVMN